MRNVNEQGGIVFPADRLQAADVRAVGVHGKDAFRDDQNAVSCIGRADHLNGGAKRLGIQMPDPHHIAGRSLCARLQAGVRQLVHDDMVVWPDQRHHCTITGGPAGRK
jgi:hypothetical protein